ncbi:hypothetical protein S40293_02211 [Stachybotrys chartarum IBT 40293]|nr:hypothetical protein S40293_02211 [Stachybotrys chartarum IBT 40293]
MNTTQSSVTEPVGRMLADRSLTLYSAYPLAIVLLAYYVLYHGTSYEPAKGSPKQWTAYHWPVIGSSLHFFARRRDMFLVGRGVFPSGYFSFFVGKKHVVGLSGAQARRVFFETKGLSLAQGFVELLTGRLPSAKNEKDYGLHNLIKPLLHLTRSDELVKRIPPISSFVATFCDELKTEPPSSSAPDWRVMNLFGKVPLLIFKIMQQCVGFQEIAQDDRLLRRTFFWYRRFENTTSNARIIFPWLVTPRHAWRLIMATVLYIDLSAILNRRKKQGKRLDDAVQFLIDKGESNYNVVEFIFSTFVAGLTTTTFTCCWLLIFLARFPTWKHRCREEVDQIMAKRRAHPGQTPNETLASLTLQDWESGLPTVGLCLRETLRMQLPGTMFRRNATGADVPIGSSGEVIPAGAYAAYPVADTHLDRELYPDPFRFNPGRYIDAEGTSTEPHTYLGWGSGRHVCAGMRLAKLLITMVTAHVLANMDFELCDPDGSDNTAVPEWDRNALRMEITGEPCYMRYRHRQ